MIRDHKKAQEVYIESIMPPIQQVDEMFCHLGLDLWSVEVIKCPGNDLENAHMINYELMGYGKYYSLKYHSKKDLRKMTQLKKFLNYPDNCLMSEYIFELWFCGKLSCDLCLHIDIRNLMTPYEQL